MAVSIHAFEDVPKDHALAYEIYVDDKPGWYDFASSTTSKMTGDEFLASLENEGG
jgi:hypothetical protein